jgi:acetolactate synthase-1/2/3 large subunit
VRHALPIVSVVGNDAGWTQIAREQVDVLHDDVATVLRSSDYHLAAEALGARGLLLEREEEMASVLDEARAAARAGQPVVINARLGRTDFRKGSISI